MSEAIVRCPECDGLMTEEAIAYRVKGRDVTVWGHVCLVCSTACISRDAQAYLQHLDATLHYPRRRRAPAEAHRC